MEVQPELASGEVKHLQRCINDLVSLLALPAIWSGGDPSQVLHTLLDALMRMLRLDLVSVRLTDPVGEAPVEIVRLAELRGPMPSAHEICEALSQCLRNDSRKWPPLLRNLMGEGDVSIVALPLGLQGELGVIVAAAERDGFSAADGGTSSERSGESGIDRAARGTAPEPSEAGCQRT